MFGFLKEKLKNVVSKITKKVEESPEVEESIKEIPKEKSKKEKKIKQEKIPELKEEVIEEPKEEKKGFFERLKQTVTSSKIDSNKFEDLFQELELALLENNVALEVIDRIKEDLKSKLVDKPLKRSAIASIIKQSLKESIEDILSQEPIDLIKLIKEKKEKPFVIVFLGVNGSGKTTSLAKVANYLKNNKISCVIAAADTWRAASLQQLEEHGKNLGIKVIKHDYGSDPAAVTFDSVKHAKAAKIDAVLVDTAGRQHSNQNLMEEMKKIIRVNTPDLKIFVGESITGNDAVTQSQEFNDSIGIDGIILTKSDVDEKGGAIISVSYITKKPILFLGLGQEYKDLQIFDKEKIIKTLGL